MCQHDYATHAQNWLRLPAATPRAALYALDEVASNMAIAFDAKQI